MASLFDQLEGEAFRKGIAAMAIIAYIMVVFGPQLMETFSG